jgi:hypothetical protein
MHEKIFELLFMLFSGGKVKRNLFYLQVNMKNLVLKKNVAEF